MEALPPSAARTTRLVRIMPSISRVALKLYFLWFYGIFRLGLECKGFSQGPLAL